MTSSIAYIAGQFPLRSETFVYREVRALRNRGWDVTCVTLHPPADVPEDAGDLTAGRLTVYGDQSLAFSPAAGWRAVLDALALDEGLSPTDRPKLIAQALAAARLAPKLRERGVRHIHCHFAHAPTTIGMYAAHLLGIPFSFTGHANDLYQRRILLKRKLRRAKFVACISEEHRRLYQSIVPRDASAYPVIRCGVDTDAFGGGDALAQIASMAGESSTRSAGRPYDASTDSTDRPVQMLTTCRLVEKKGIDTLLRALAGVGTPGGPAVSEKSGASKDAGRGRTWHLTIAGDGPQRAELEALAAKVGIANRVTFLGPVANDRVRDLLKSADLFALPCRVDRNGDKDGIPVVLIEAMASGVPVVAGDLPAIRELVIDGRTGLLVDGNRVQPTTDALARLLGDGPLRKRLSEAGRAHVIDEFSLLRNVGRLEAALWQ